MSEHPAFVKSILNDTFLELSFNVLKSYEIPTNLASASITDFQSVLTFASTLLHVHASLATQYAKEVFFADILKQIKKDHDSQISKVQSESILDVKAQLNPLLTQISQLTSDKAKSELELRKSYEKEISTHLKTIAELQSDLCKTSKSDAAVRDACRLESDRLLQMVESKNLQVMKAKEESLAIRESTLATKEQQLQVKLLRASSSSLRGQDGETYFANLVKDKMNWTLTDTRHVSHACDYQSTIHNTLSFFEIKHYTHPVPQKEVTKFLRDMKEHPEALFGAFISLNTHIQGIDPKQSITIEWINESQCILYIQSCSDLDIDHVLCTIDQLIKITKTFNKLIHSNESNEPVFQQRIEQAKQYIQTSLTRCQSLIRRVQLDKKQLLSLIETNMTHSILELKQQSAELATSIQILLGDFSQLESDDIPNETTVVKSEKLEKLEKAQKAKRGSKKKSETTAP